MYDNEIKKLKNLKNKIIRSKNNQERLLLINDYFALDAVLTELGYEGEEYEFSNFNKYIERYNKGNIDHITEFLFNYPYIREINREVLRLYQENKFIDINKVDIKNIKEKEVLEFFKDFVASLGDDFYKLLKKLFDEKRIYLKNLDNAAGETFGVNYTDSSYVLINRDDALIRTLILAHEFGHCYHNMISSDTKNLFVLNPKVEIPSVFMEKLFLDALINEPYFKEYGLDYEELFNVSLIDKTKLDMLNYLLIDSGIVGVVADTSGYGLDYVNEFDLSKLINNSEDLKVLENYYPTLDYPLYNMPALISDNLIKMYKQDKKETLKLFKNYLATDYLYTYKEVLDTYLNDLSETGKSFQRTKEYQKKKYHL